MICSEEDEQAVGFADLRVFREWLAKAPVLARIMAALYPPGVYRMTTESGEVLRVVPQEYAQSSTGEMVIHVVADVRINPEFPGMIPHRIVNVPLARLVPIKWPPDARVH